MVFDYLARIPHIWKEIMISLKIHEDVAVGPLPDEVIIEILSRLSTNEVPKCRMVCNNWNALTWTPYFAEMHLRKATPIVFLQLQVPLTFDHSGLAMFFIDEADKKMVKKDCLRSITVDPFTGPPVLINSCNGLLLFNTYYHTFNCYIWNPLTRLEITLRKPSQDGILCALFFHSASREYRLIYAFETENGWCYQIRSLVPSNDNWRTICFVRYAPIWICYPVIVDGFIYWKVTDFVEPSLCCAECIMTFNMNTEEFHVMPHPGNICASHERHYLVQLLQVESELLCCDLDQKHLVIWVLKDRAEWIWLKKYQVSLELDLKRYPFVNSDPTYEIRFVRIQNEELLLFWFRRGLFRYHLRLKMVREIKIPGSKIPGLNLTEVMDGFLRIAPYTKSFVSPQIKQI